MEVFIEIINSTTPLVRFIHRNALVLLSYLWFVHGNDCEKLRR